MGKKGKKRQNRRKSKQGMTLIEIVVATAILGTLSVAFVNSFRAGIKAFSYYQKRTEALILAQAKLEEVLGLGYEHIVASAKEGKLPLEPQSLKDSYRWQIELGSPMAGTMLRPLSLHVLWDFSGQERRATLVTYVTLH